MTIQRVGLIDSLSKIVSLVIEVPTGAIADKFGRKKSLVFGHLALALCCMVIVIANNFSLLLLGNIIMFIGFSLLSGAKEALLYDNMKAEKIDHHYEHVLGRIGFIVTVSSVTTIFLGGLLYKIAPEATFYVWGTANVIAIFVLAGIKEHSFGQHEEHATSSYFSKISDGIRTLFSRRLIVYTSLILYLAMLIKSYEGVIRQSTSMYFGLTGETFAYLFAIVSIPSAIASYNFGRLFKKFGYRILVIILSSYIFGFITIFLFKNLPAFLVSFILIYVSQELAKPLITVTVNRHTDSSHRATTLSVVSLLSEIPYIVITGLFGSILLNVNINKFYLVQAIIVSFASLSIVIYGILQRSRGST